MIVRDGMKNVQKDSWVTSGSVHGAARLAASACRRVAWGSGLVTQTGLVSVGLAAVVVAIVALAAL